MLPPGRARKPAWGQFLDFDIYYRKLKRWGRMLWMDQEQDILNRYMIFTEKERTDKCVVL